MLIPKNIAIVGTLFLVAGSAALLDIVVSPFLDKVSLNFGVLMFFVGRGLLAGKSSSRLWAYAWIAIGYLAIALIFGLSIWSPENATFTWDERKLSIEDAIVPAIITGIAALALLTWMLRVLRDRDYDGFFGGAA